MTTKQIQEVIKDITSANSAKTTLEDLNALLVKDTKAIPHIFTIPLASKYNYVPYADIPAPDDTTFVLGAFEVARDIIPIDVVITDETIEDASVPVEEALKNIIAAQVILKAEKYVGDYFATFSATSTNLNKSMDTVIDTIISLGTRLQVPGTIMVHTSYSTYFALKNTATSAQQKMMDDGDFIMVPIANMSDSEIIIVHSYGLRFGREITGLEVARNGSIGGDDLVIQLSIGIAASPDYVKRVTLN